MMTRYSRQVIAAGKANELVADAGGPLPGHSVFTGHLNEGMKGTAVTENGVMTANGLMAYVYQRVAQDKNSKQTPHYGHFDGDGDFVFTPNSLSDDAKKEVDQLAIVPYVTSAPSLATTSEKVEQVKALLPSESSAIKLHDFLIEEVREFLSATSDDHFPIQAAFSGDGFRGRLNQYDDSIRDLSSLLACVTYWATPSQSYLIQKVLSRSTDGLVVRKSAPWENLRWYPLVVLFYVAGIASIEGKKYDSLASIFYATVPTSDPYGNENYFVEAIAEESSSLKDVVGKIPGHERQYVPVSEHLYKNLQPTLDDVLYISKNYERSFDQFEILFTLAAIDCKKSKNRYLPIPLGRFAWKSGNYQSDPYSSLRSEVQAAGENWAPLKAGLFGGSIDRFNAAVEYLNTWLSKLNWD